MSPWRGPTPASRASPEFLPTARHATESPNSPDGLDGSVDSAMNARSPVPDFLASAPPGIRRDFLAAATHVDITAGCPVMTPGQACASVAFVTSGRVRVFQVGVEGREVTLYHIGRDECCVLTVACLLGRQPFPALARAATETKAWVVPAAEFRRWVGASEFWRDYVFGLLGRRLGEVLLRLEDVAFRRVDARLAEAILRRAGPQGRFVTVTQQQLADELGTAREVVSRVLAGFKATRSLRVSRGRIELLDRASVEALVART